MTLQQLEYILAVSQFRHFAKAAEHCRVTQPTLSAMIQKLEDELDTKIFDRSQQPICPTPVGQLVIEQARIVLEQAGHIKDIIEEEKHSLSGVFKLGILPTIAPYLGGELIEKGELRVSVLHSDAKWFGMTYHEDKDAVAAALKALHDAGVYPPTLHG